MPRTVTREPGYGKASWKSNRIIISGCSTAILVVHSPVTAKLKSEGRLPPAKTPSEALPSPANPGQWHAVTASFLGWTLDAFDFFVLVFLVDTLAAQFQVTKSAMVWTITATLAIDR